MSWREHLMKMDRMLKTTTEDRSLTAHGPTGWNECTEGEEHAEANMDEHF
jgi:hypothetical protein